MNSDPKKTSDFEVLLREAEKTEGNSEYPEGSAEVIDALRVLEDLDEETRAPTIVTTTTLHPR